MKRLLLVIVLVPVVLGVSSSIASAQEKGQIGIAMGYPSSVGIVWHVTDKVAIRPEFSVAQSSTETTINGLTPGTAATTTDGWAIGTGVSGLIYIRSWDQLHLYVSPRWTYSHLTMNTSATSSTTTEWAINGSVGAQYALGKRFGVFGELGLGYAHLNQTFSTQVGLEGHGHTVGTRTGVGVIIYF
jgi:hypothetical protein